MVRLRIALLRIYIQIRFSFDVTCRYIRCIFCACNRIINRHGYKIRERNKIFLVNTKFKIIPFAQTVLKNVVTSRTHTTKWWTTHSGNIKLYKIVEFYSDIIFCNIFSILFRGKKYRLIISYYDFSYLYMYQHLSQFFLHKHRRKLVGLHIFNRLTVEVTAH